MAGSLGDLRNGVVRRRFTVGICLAGVSLAWAVSASAAPPSAASQGDAASCHWVPSWGSSQMEPNGKNRLPASEMTDATVREVVRISVPGKRIRVRLSNVDSNAPLHIDGASVALSAGNATAKVIAGTQHNLSFGNLPQVTIAPGAAVLSDPVDLPAKEFADLTVSIHYPEAPAQETSHPGSRATTWVAHGNLVDAADLPDASSTVHWFNLSQVQVEQCGAPPAPVVVALGDSITDGHAVPTNSNTRWTDFLAHRLAGKMAVLNEGIGGNRVLLNGLGPDALSRLDRDVLAIPGVQDVIVLEGINDIGVLSRDKDATAADYAQLVTQLEQAYRQIVERAHSHGIKVFGGTIMPFAGNGYYHSTPLSDGARQEVNQWIRTSGVFDGVIDFDAAMRDPKRPAYLNPVYDSGDGLHPGPKGYAAMADAIPLDLLEPGSDQSGAK